MELGRRLVLGLFFFLLVYHCAVIWAWERLKSAVRGRW